MMAATAVHFRAFDAGAEGAVPYSTAPASSPKRGWHEPQRVEAPVAFANASTDVAPVRCATTNVPLVTLKQLHTSRSSGHAEIGCAVFGQRLPSAINRS